MHGKRLAGACLITGIAVLLGACGGGRSSVNMDELSANTSGMAAPPAGSLEPELPSDVNAAPDDSANTAFELSGMPDSTITASAGSPAAAVTCSAAGFTLAVSPDSFLIAGPAATFAIETQSHLFLQADGADEKGGEDTSDTSALLNPDASDPIDRGSEIVITISARDAVDLRALYCDLTYDPACYTPVSVEHLAWDGDTGEMLTLEVLSEPGVVHLGQVLANWDQRAGLNGDAELARVRFAAEPFEQGRKASDALPVATERPLLTVIMQPAWLDWRFHQIGDYNQDGLVTASDLTPVGAHFSEAGDVLNGYISDPDGALVETFDFAGGDVRQLIDTSDNGVVDIYDITAIGVNFGQGVDSFAVYHAASPAAYSADGPAAVEPLAMFPISQVRHGDTAAEQVVFNTPLAGLVDGDYYWIQPLNGGTPGPSSELTQIDLSLVDDFTAELREECFIEGGQIDGVRAEVGVSGDWVAVDLIIQGYEQMRYLSTSLHYDESNYRVAEAWGYLPGYSYRSVMPKLFGEAPFYLCRALHEGRLLTTYEFKNVTANDDWRIARAFFLREPGGFTGVAPEGYWSDGNPNVFYDSVNQIMSWEYMLPGDGNQDSVVLADDLLPIMRFKDQSVAEVGEAAALADYSQDGYVSLGDLMVFGQNYGMHLEGYRILMGTMEAFEYQDDSLLLGSVNVLEDAIGDRFNERLRFEFHVEAPVSGQYLWVAIRIGEDMYRHIGYPAYIP